MLVVNNIMPVVCFLQGNSTASEFYMPTFRNTLFHLHRQVGTSTFLWRWNRQSVPKRRHIKFRRWRITQKKTCNIQSTTEVWNQEYYVFLFIFRTWRKGFIKLRIDIHVLLADERDHLDIFPKSATVMSVKMVPCVWLVMSAVNVLYISVSFWFLLARLKDTSNIAALI